MKRSAGKKTLKAAAYILITALVVTAFSVMNVAESYAAKTFTDINSHWGKPYIEEAAALGIVSGYPEGDFKPDNLMKREEFFSMVVKILTETPVPTEETKKMMATFGDVIPGEWYVGAIEQAVAAGITEGQTYYSFGVGMMVTRQEAAKVVSSIISGTENMTAEQIAEGKAKYNSLKDTEQIADWAKAHVEKVVTKGYVKGDDKGYFNPTNALTRAEAATLLLSVVKNEKVILGPKQERVGDGSDNASGTDGSTASAITATGSGVTDSENTGEDLDYEKEYSIEKKVARGSSYGCKCSEEGHRFAAGTGTIADPYIIEDDKDLNHIRVHATEGAYFLLKNDIYISADFSEEIKSQTESNPWEKGNFQPIGDKNKPFNGHLDGNGYAVYDLRIEGKQQYAGLFGYIGKTGSVENLYIEDSSIKGGQYVGGIAGYNEGVVSYCTLGKRSKIEGSSYVGGIIGYSTEAVSNNRNNGTVQSTVSAAGGIVGGMMLTEKDISRCVNNGTVKGYQKVGGIVGSATGFDKGMTVLNCSNLGTVESENYNAGGIIGEFSTGGSKGFAKNCYNKGIVTGSAVNGGIVGETSSNLTISYCYNQGKAYGAAAGGIAGRNAGVIEFCANIGDVEGKTNAGGLVALQEGDRAKIIKSYNSGSVKADNVAAGIVGENYQKVQNCYNDGKVEARVYAGGLVGRNRGSINTCYNAGTVTANLPGEIAGFNTTGNIKYVCWLKGSGENSVAQSDGVNAKAPSYSYALTKEQMEGKEKVVLSEKDSWYFVDYLNRNADDDLWEETKTYSYPSLIGFPHK